jgi:hypothetical protein
MESANDAATAANETIAPCASSGQVADTGAAGADAGVDSNGGLAGVAAKPDLDTELRAVWDKNHPQRASNGRFVARDGGAGEGPAGGDAYIAYIRSPADAGPNPTPPLSPGQALPSQAEEPRDELAGNEANRPVEQEKPAIDPPISWSAEMKGRWSHLPPDVQTYVAQRDKETHAAITRAGQYLKALDQQIKGYEPLDQLIEAHQDMFARRGVTPAQGFAVLLDAQRKLEADPVAGLVHVGLGYGVDLRPFFQARSGHSSQGGQQPSANQVAPDPRTAQLLTELREELRQTKHALAAHESKANAKERTERQARDATLRGALAEFAHDKPYFEEVKPLMAALVDSRQARDFGRSLRHGGERPSRHSSAHPRGPAPGGRGEACRRGEDQGRPGPPGGCRQRAVGARHRNPENHGRHAERDRAPSLQLRNHANGISQRNLHRNGDDHAAQPRA